MNITGRFLGLVSLGLVFACAAARDPEGKSEDAVGMRGMNMDGGMNMDAAPGASQRPLPNSIAISAVTEDALFVVNGGDNTVSVIDPVQQRVVGTIALRNAKFPHHIYASQDQKRLAVAVPGMDMSGGHHGGMAGMRGAVMVLDAATGATTASRFLDAMNHNAAFSPDNTEIWTSQMVMGGSVLVLDAQTLATKSSIRVGDMPAEVTFSVDRKQAFVANGMSNNVTVIDVATKLVVATVATGKDPVLASPGSDGRVYVDCETSKSVSVLDPVTQSVALTYDLRFTPGMAKVLPDGSGLVVTNVDDGKLVFYAVGADTKTGEVETGAGAHGIEFSRDGTTAYVTNQLANSVSLVDLRSRAVTATIPVGKKPNGLVFRKKP